MSNLKNIDLGTPTYSLALPSTKKEIKFRPFLVKEEKILMQAIESKDETAMIDALKKVCGQCLESKDVDVNKLPTFDLEYIFMQLRAKSVGETAKIGLKCKKDEVVNEIDVDLANIKVVTGEGHTTTIKLTDTVGMEMKYPTYDDIKSITKTKGTEGIFDTIVASVKTIYNGDDVIDASTVSTEELKNFVERLTAEQFKLVQKFFDTMPKLTSTVKYTCKKCSTENEQVLEGMASFF